jgi:SAM-dependent methyltransferase
VLEVGDPEALREFGQVFDDVAEAYDEVRPGYPDELVELAMERGGLEPGSRVLEIGCGTGKLTELLAAHGLDVDAVEPGQNMVEAARRRVGDGASVRFHVGRFEDLELPENAFAAVFSATAFHWVDPAVGWRKSASHLVPGGVLALFTHRGAPDGRSVGVEAEFRALIGKYAPDVADTLPPERDLATIVAGAEDRRGNASEVWDWLRACATSSRLPRRRISSRMSRSQRESRKSSARRMSSVRTSRRRRSISRSIRSCDRLSWRKTGRSSNGTVARSRSRRARS